MADAWRAEILHEACSSLYGRRKGEGTFSVLRRLLRAPFPAVVRNIHWTADVNEAAYRGRRRHSSLLCPPLISFSRVLGEGQGEGSIASPGRRRSMSRRQGDSYCVARVWAIPSSRSRPAQEHGPTSVPGTRERA